MNDNQTIHKALTILAKRLCNGKPLTSSADTAKFLQLKLAPRKREVFGVVFLTNQHSVIAYEELFQGTIDGASVYPREVAIRALHHNASAVIFAHNHPSGVSEPSKADENITKQLVSALKLLHIRVLDHFVVTAGETVSFAEKGLL